MYTITLREIIYQTTQNQNPLERIQGLDTAKSVSAYRPVNYQPGDGQKYPFYKAKNYPTIEERIKAAQSTIMSETAVFATQEFKDSFWNAFCTEFLMREIEYPTTGVFILKFNQRLRNMLPRYNTLYRAIQVDLEPFISYRDMTDRGLNENSGRNENGNSDTNSNSNSKNVFEDTPENKLGNVDYATNITTVNQNSNSNNKFKTELTAARNVSEGIVREGFDRPKIELLSELFERLNDLIIMMVHDVGDPLFLKIFN